ncbi:MAG: hypothetical protein N3A01_01695 [Bacteroidales bacterium]|nr:hypothetical protein [Bacteroidales bacterium]
MKFIISHDVDHITVFEHYKDLILPKFILRSLIECIFGTVSVNEIIYRFNDFFKNKWNNIVELAEFNSSKNIKTTFFLGVEKGKGMCYSEYYCSIFFKYLHNKGFPCGLHAVNYSNKTKMLIEFNKFKNITNLTSFGVRTHYLKLTENTLLNFSEIGYTFDSSVYGLKNPYKIGKMWEFPLCLMDGKIFYGNKRFQNKNIKQAKEITLKLIEEANNSNLNYFTILFHDRYFSDSFRSLKEWYMWLIEFLQHNKFNIITFEEAIKEIEKAN